MSQRVSFFLLGLVVAALVYWLFIKSIPIFQIILAGGITIILVFLVIVILLRYALGQEVWRVLNEAKHVPFNPSSFDEIWATLKGLVSVRTIVALASLGFAFLVASTLLQVGNVLIGTMQVSNLERQNEILRRQNEAVLQGAIFQLEPEINRLERRNREFELAHGAWGGLQQACHLVDSPDELHGRPTLIDDIVCESDAGFAECYDGISERVASVPDDVIELETFRAIVEYSFQRRLGHHSSRCGTFVAGDDNPSNMSVALGMIDRSQENSSLDAYLMSLEPTCGLTNQEVIWVTEALDNLERIESVYRAEGKIVLPSGYRSSIEPSSWEYVDEDANRLIFDQVSVFEALGANPEQDYTEEEYRVAVFQPVLQLATSELILRYSWELCEVEWDNVRRNLSQLRADQQRLRGFLNANRLPLGPIEMPVVVPGETLPVQLNR